jgi:tripartite-type tricarboxylate transporter receptor subunit TctC
MNAKISCFAALLAFACTAFAQTYPTKLVRLVIPYPPGGVDITTRILLPSIEQDLGQPWVIDYRSGAGGIIGQEYVARQPADGYTLLVTLANSWVVAPAVRRSTPFNPLTDFTPISLGIEPMGVIVANNGFAPNSLTELLEWIKRNPGKAAWATSGIGSSWHINGEIAKLRGGFDVLHTPYQGFGPMIPAVMGGQVPLAMFAYSTIQPMITTGKVKLIGVTNSTGAFKSLVPPGVQGLVDVAPGMQFVPDWIGLAGPAGLPEPIVRRVHAAYVKALNQPDLADRWQRDKILVVASTPEQLAERVRNDFALVQRAVQVAGIPPQE